MAQRQATEAAAAHELALAGQASQGGAWALGRDGDAAAEASAGSADLALVLCPVTTVVISGLPASSTPLSVRRVLEERGLAGTFDFLYLPATDAAYRGFLEGAWYDTERLAVVNFTTPGFATLCSWLFQDLSEGIASFAPVQGLEQNISYCGRLAGLCPPAGFAPVVLEPGAPCPWAVYAAQALLLDPDGSTLGMVGQQVGELAAAPKELKGQLRKTKLCDYFWRRRDCRLGASCPFAHSEGELQPLPDLAKTRLCFAFQRGRCRDQNCRYAHGRQELRATGHFYKTELCHGWAAGSCKAEAFCRYAHGEGDLRSGAAARAPHVAAWSDAPAFGWSLEEAPPAPASRSAAGSAEEPVPSARERAHRANERAAHNHAPQLRADTAGASAAILGAVGGARNVLARPSRTFMEAVPTGEEALALELPKRSFSCSDLDELAKAMEADEHEVEDPADSDDSGGGGLNDFW